MYVPIGVEDCVVTVRLDETLDPEESVRLEGANVRVGPEGEETPVRVIVPENPFKLERTIEEVAVEPALADMLVGLAEMLKSGDCATGARNSDIDAAFASFEVRDARFQLASIVFVSE